MALPPMKTIFALKGEERRRKVMTVKNDATSARSALTSNNTTNPNSNTGNGGGKGHGRKGNCGGCLARGHGWGGQLGVDHDKLYLLEVQTYP